MRSIATDGVVRSVYVSVGHVVTTRPWTLQNWRTDRDGVWSVDSWGPRIHVFVLPIYFKENKLLHCRDTRQKNDFHSYAVQSEIGKRTVRYRGTGAVSYGTIYLMTSKTLHHYYLLKLIKKLFAADLRTATVCIYYFSLYLYQWLHTIVLCMYKPFTFARFLFLYFFRSVCVYCVLCFFCYGQPATMAACHCNSWCVLSMLCTC